MWNEYYPGQSYSYEHKTRERINILSGQFFVHDILFSCLKTQIICLNGSKSDKLLVAQSLFDSNSGGYDFGGNIFQSNGSSVHYRICCIKSSYSTGPGYLDYARTIKADVSLKCLIKDSTFSQCGTYVGPFVIYDNYNHIITNTTSSHNTGSFGNCAGAIARWKSSKII